MLPSLGAGLLTKLQPAQISEMYAKVLGSGRKDGTGGLSLANVLYTHRLLKQALGRRDRMAAAAVESGRPNQGT